jgi:anti-sigma B factor antagonist
VHARPEPRGASRFAEDVIATLVEGHITRNDASDRLPAFSFRTERGAAVLAVTGELDLAWRDQFAAALRELEERQGVDVDVSGLAFLDVTAATVLLAAAGRAQRAGRELRVVGSAGAVARVLALVGYEPLLDAGALP